MNQIKSYSLWFRLGIFNLVLVAIWGTLMRYKIAFSLPFVDQKFLIHAHSHFAFTGWIAHILYTGLAMVLAPYIDESKHKKYTRILILNLISAYGMLIAFSLQGYKAASITFSTLSLIVAGIYTYHFIKDSLKVPAEKAAFLPWARTGLMINVFSSLGPFALAYLMVSKNMDPLMVNSSIYFYLHFQYDGWFLFGAVALIIALLPKDFPSLETYSHLWAITIIPTYILSILFWKFPLWLVLIAGISAAIQLYAWIMMIIRYVNYYKKKKVKDKVPSWLRFFFYTAAVCISLKFVLQLLSVLPGLTVLVFSCKPIIIGYLHLILLGAYTFFILAYSFHLGLLKSNSIAKFATYLFFFGFFLNELFLALQASTWVTHVFIPNGDKFLFVAAVTMLLGAIVLLIAQIKKEKMISH
ncbi:MAG TPA: hypothetical protein VLZ83_03255 [Edaphocola sp.]|nr:hypothetical protein [Edaphocola sp.]